MVAAVADSVVAVVADSGEAVVASGEAVADIAAVVASPAAATVAGADTVAALESASRVADTVAGSAVPVTGTAGDTGIVGCTASDSATRILSTEDMVITAATIRTVTIPTAITPTLTIAVAYAPPSSSYYDSGPAVAPPARPVQSREYQEPIYLIAFSDHRIQACLAYWVEGDTLHYVTREHEHKQIGLDGIDRAFSEQLNRDRRVEFRLPQQR